MIEPCGAVYDEPLPSPPRHYKRHRCEVDVEEIALHHEGQHRANGEPGEIVFWDDDDCRWTREDVRARTIGGPQ